MRIACSILSFSAVAMLGVSPYCAAANFTFKLSGAYVTSAGVYAGTVNGPLVRTLWRGESLGAGTHSRTWDERDDSGSPVAPGTYKIKVLYHNVSYVWEGVIGNTSSSFVGPGVHRSLLPPRSLAISGATAYMALNYNEGGFGMRKFTLANPQYVANAVDRHDSFTAWGMVATDGSRVYWANVGRYTGPDYCTINRSISTKSFIVASDAASGAFAPFSTGQPICLNYRQNSTVCYEDQYYPSVIDINEGPSDPTPEPPADQCPAIPTPSPAPTGIAVQTNGNILAVAHGGLNTVKLFDKLSGTPVGNISVALEPFGVNQLAMAPNGDLWVVSGSSVFRYTNLNSTPERVATIGGLSHPLTVAVDPGNSDRVLVADGGASQQVKAFDSSGRNLWTYGQLGGYNNNPTVSVDKLWFFDRPAQEETSIAIQPDGSFWVVDTANHRMLHISPSLLYLEQVAYVPISYSATVDPNNPKRVFSNFLEYKVDYAVPLIAGANSSWTLVRNWLAGLPVEAQNVEAFNRGFGGLNTVVTLTNPNTGAGKRTYAVMNQRNQVMLELPTSGPARYVGPLTGPGTNETAKVLYENGDLRYAYRDRASGSQTVYARLFVGWDGNGNPQWMPPYAAASAPTLAGSPYNRGAFSGATGPRFPYAGGKMVFFDQTVNDASRSEANEGFHLGALGLSGTLMNKWVWQASPTGALDGKGSFQTQAVETAATGGGPWINYGGNMVWTRGRNILYGFHGEFYRDLSDLSTLRLGQANQFMHFYDDGLFVGQFGTPLVCCNPDSLVGGAGNAFSNILVNVGGKLYLYHNDESHHGGVHRWQLKNASDIKELTVTVSVPKL